MANTTDPENNLKTAEQTFYDWQGREDNTKKGQSRDGSRPKPFPLQPTNKRRRNGVGRA